MLRVAVAVAGLAALLWLCFDSALLVGDALAQGATVQIHPSDGPPPTEVNYPDAVTCNVTSPDSVEYKIVFYKSQTASFANERNNVAEYGTTFLRDPDKFDASQPYKWRLQLGQPGNITLFALPSGWTTANCPVGKPISNLIADKQALRIFSPQ